MMRYQVRILGATPKRRWWHLRPRYGRDYNFASSEDLDGAMRLLAAAPFYLGETCFVEDTETKRWLAIKRGRVTSKNTTAFREARSAPQSARPHR